MKRLGYGLVAAGCPLGLAPLGLGVPFDDGPVGVTVLVEQTTGLLVGGTVVAVGVHAVFTAALLAVLAAAGTGAAVELSTGRFVPVTVRRPRSVSPSLSPSSSPA